MEWLGQQKNNIETICFKLPWLHYSRLLNACIYQAANLFSFLHLRCLPSKSEASSLNNKISVNTALVFMENTLRTKS